MARPRVTTRRADPRDAAALATTLIEAFDGYREWAPAGWSPDVPRAATTAGLADALSRPDVWCLLAERQGEPIGHVALSRSTVIQPEVPPAGTVNLWQLFVRPAWHGAGVAPLLLRSAVSEAHRRGFTRLRLWTPRGAVRARRFYEREGWTRTGEERQEPAVELPVIEYERAVVEVCG